MLDLHPYTILITVLVLLTIKQVVSSVGKSNVQGVAWALYLKLGSRLGLNKSFIEIAGKKNELAQVTREKRSISAQDEYAKWTKLNRSADKLLADIKVIEGSIAQDRAKVDRLVGISITIGTTLPIWFCRAWFRKSVLLYLPQGVFPYYVEWALALPFITVGGVGLTIWMFSVNHVLSAISLLISFPLEKSVEKPILVEKIVEEKQSKKP